MFNVFEKPLVEGSMDRKDLFSTIETNVDTQWNNL
jgi:hypothetical protein